MNRVLRSLLLLFLTFGCSGTSADRVDSAENQAAEPPVVSQPVAAEESVKPGINESFLDPELDVDRMVQRFEGDNREIFVQRHRIARAIGLKPGMAIADVGAGTGLFLDYFAKDVGTEGRVYAVDIAEKFVEHLKQRAAQRGFDQVETVLCTERSVELADASIDVAFICDVYHHFEYPRSTMGSIHRALRDGGDVVIVDFERIPGVTREWVLNHVRAGKDEVIAELDSFGFERVEEVDVAGMNENYWVRFRKR